MDEKVSWEGHMFGLLAGIIVAVVYRKQGPQKPKYSWDFVEEETVPEWFPDAERDRRRQAEQQLEKQREAEKEATTPRINIKYVYKQGNNQMRETKKASNSSPFLMQ